MNKSEKIELTIQTTKKLFNPPLLELDHQRQRDCSFRPQQWDSLETLSNNNNSIKIESVAETNRKQLGLNQKTAADHLIIAGAAAGADNRDKNWGCDCCNSANGAHIKNVAKAEVGVNLKTQLTTDVPGLFIPLNSEHKDKSAAMGTDEKIEESLPLLIGEEIQEKPTPQPQLAHRQTSAVNSNRTSVNNSTENLSYTSDNYYGDELIVLQNALSDDEEEEVSLNSDDCVYAYRGGGEFDVALEPAVRNNNIVEDETDFLEMDFDPDLSSEMDPTVEMQPISYPGSIFLQSCSKATGERQLFSSPIDGMRSTLAAPQSVALSKDFARVSLHLNQIKADIASNELVDPAIAIDDVDGDDGDDGNTETIAAHSLPTLSSPFHSCIVPTDEKKSKITGAKPKRIAPDRHCFFASTSSSSSSFTLTKNRTKQQQQPQIGRPIKCDKFRARPLCSSNSFDERSISYSFPHDVKLTCDDTCLDCLENEFLANTIGKVIDWTRCPKCKNKRTNLSFEPTMQRQNQQLQLSAKNVPNGGADEAAGITTAQKQPHHTKPTSLSFDFNQPTYSNNTSHGGAGAAAHKRNAFSEASAGNLIHPTLVTHNKTSIAQHQRSSCDNFDRDQLLTDKVSTFSNINVNEEILVQALDKLQISYNAELIKSHFRTESLCPNNEQKDYKNLKHFILHESKKNCNYPKMKRLIELATSTADGCSRVAVRFHVDNQITHTEMVPVQVADILHQWTKKNNLELLKQLDKRFIEANVLGKIANIIRQAQQRCATRRTMTEFILIPQYYKSGYISLTKK